jgi:hypothetical protein
MNIQETMEKAKEDFSPGDGEEEEEYEDYDVWATYKDEKGNFKEEFVGTLSLKKINHPNKMPKELEIDGVIYTPKF